MRNSFHSCIVCLAPVARDRGFCITLRTMLCLQQRVGVSEGRVCWLRLTSSAGELSASPAERRGLVPVSADCLTGLRLTVWCESQLNGAKKRQMCYTITPPNQAVPATARWVPRCRRG
eukprot:scaffold534_cov63-Phaeocystis_antarctica.AAC.4